MDKINLKNKRKLSQIYISKELNIKNKSTSNTSSCKSKDESSLPILETFNKYKDNLKSLIRKNINQDSSQPLFKQINNILNKISDIIKELNYQINQYKNALLFNESKIRNLQGKMFTELFNTEGKRL